MMETIFICMILSVNNGGSLVANCRPEHHYTKQEFNNIILMVEDIEAPFNNQPYAEESKQNLTTLCLNKEAKVKVTLHNNQFIYGSVNCNGTNVAEFQIASGMALMSEKSKSTMSYEKSRFMEIYSGKKNLLKAEQKAQSQKLGIWKDINFK